MSHCIDDVVHTNNKISTLRLQPIVDLTTGESIAYEVLAGLATGLPEPFFNKLSLPAHKKYFYWLLERFDKINGVWWVNIPAALIIERDFLLEYKNDAICHHFYLEIQDPENLCKMSSTDMMKLKNRILELRKRGWKIILDDLTSDRVGFLMPLSLQFDAIKIDKSQITSSTLSNTINVARYFGPFIVIEGIETPEHLQIAVDAGADAGQGFYWPEKVIKNHSYFF